MVFAFAGDSTMTKFFDIVGVQVDDLSEAHHTHPFLLNRHAVCAKYRRKNLTCAMQQALYNKMKWGDYL